MNPATHRMPTLPLADTFPDTHTDTATGQLILLTYTKSRFGATSLWSLNGRWLCRIDSRRF